MPHNLHRKPITFLLLLVFLLPGNAHSFKLRDAVMLGSGAVVAGLGVTLVVKSGKPKSSKNHPSVEIQPWASSHQRVDSKIFLPSIRYLQSRKDNQINDTPLPNWTQNELGLYLQNQNLNEEDLDFFKLQHKNTYENPNFIFNAQWKNSFTIHNSTSTNFLELNAGTHPFFSHENGMYAPESFSGTSGNFYAEYMNFLSMDYKPHFFFTDIPGQRKYATKELYGSVHLNKLSLDVGKAQLHWGNGAYHPMIFSDDSDPFFIVRARNNEEIEFSHFLSFLGKTKFELMAGWLDEYRQYPNGKIIGAMFSFQPTSRFQFHFSQTVLYGGTNSPTENPLIFFNESFLNSKKNPANRNSTIGFRYRIPNLEIEPYADLYIEDCCGKPLINPRDVQNLFGIYFPARDALKKFDFTLEWVRTNYITYRHDALIYSQSQKTLGNPLGPDAQGFYLIGRYFHSKKLQLEGIFSYEIRGRSGRALSNKGFIPIQTIEPSFQSAEERNRYEQTISYYATPAWLWSIRAGVEHVNNENYRQGKYGWYGLFGLESAYNF